MMTMRRFGQLLAIIVAALVIAVTTAGSTEAKPVTARGTISARVQSQRELCEIGGGKLDVSNTYGSYTNGRPLLSSTTTCKGGTGNGYTCVNTKKTTDCSKALTGQPDSHLADAVVDSGQVLESDPAATAATEASDVTFSDSTIVLEPVIVETADVAEAATAITDTTVFVYDTEGEQP